jgi:spore maturation protein CgeB
MGMRLLLGHGFPPLDTLGANWIERWLARLRAAGIDVHPIHIGLDVPGYRLPWKELDRRWKRGDATLMRLYERIADASLSYDVLINYGGLNLHPDFLRQLGTVNVLGFFDDPESSAEFSHPVAAGHDICAVGNIAELEGYTAAGAATVCWWPLGFRFDDFDSSLTERDILSNERSNDIALLCERVTHFRRERVDRFARQFPQGIYRGPGWPLGFLPESDRVPLLQETKIGINIHNSSGPVNFRTYYLPANGVLQICDNRQHLARIFEPGSEVIGYETIDEAIDYCRYYLAHEEERREIAAAGFRRAVRDYNEVESFRHVTRAVERFQTTQRRRAPSESASATISRHVEATRAQRALHALARPVMGPIRFAPRVAGGAWHRWLRLRDNLLQRVRSKTVQTTRIEK